MFISDMHNIFYFGSVSIRLFDKKLGILFGMSLIRFGSKKRGSVRIL